MLVIRAALQLTQIHRRRLNQAIGVRLVESLLIDSPKLHLAYRQLIRLKGDQVVHSKSIETPLGRATKRKVPAIHLGIKTRGSGEVARAVPVGTSGMLIGRRKISGDGIGNSKGNGFVSAFVQLAWLTVVNAEACIASDAFVVFA